MIGTAGGVRSIEVPLHANAVKGDDVLLAFRRHRFPREGGIGSLPAEGLVLGRFRVWQLLLGREPGPEADRAEEAATGRGAGGIGWTVPLPRAIMLGEQDPKRCETGDHDGCRGLISFFACEP